MEWEVECQSARVTERVRQGLRDVSASGGRVCSQQLGAL